jgi:hypothetical protein
MAGHDFLRAITEHVVLVILLPDWLAVPGCSAAIFYKLTEY